MMHRWRTYWLTCCALAIAVWVHADEPSPSGPFSPQQSLEKFQLADGLKIELVADEPNVVDPVAIRFDDRARMWVVEMRDYPNGPAPGEPPLSKIKVLHDYDQDGYYESARVFAENLLFPTGIQPWKDGVIVTFSGRVAYLRDKDGDEVADEVTDLFTGFAEDNPQLRANHPVLALDNHIYIANGLRGGEIRAANSPNAPRVSISGRDFRYDPLTHHYEAVAGVGQFGMTFDDFGRRFVCSNRNPLRHVVMEDRYLQTNPAIPIAEVVQDVAAAEDKSRLFPISRAWTTSNLHANQFTAACGVLIYRGRALPNHTGNAFTCDPTGNLVHCEIVQPAGATFVSRPAEQDKEFLASTDEWFRPVNLEIGPGGALYIIDMYRAVIEHPEWVPDELKHRPDERFGDDRGRIYRVIDREVAKEVRYEPIIPPGRFGPGSFWASQLETGDEFVADTVARLILESQSDEHVQSLRNLAASSKTPVTRSRAMWLLQGLGALTVDDLVQALRDPDLCVREQAMILAEPHLLENSQLRALVLDRSEDAKSNARICFQAMLSLAPVQSEDEAFAVATMVFRFPNDPWIRRAGMIASGQYAPVVAGQILSLTELTSTKTEVLVPLCREFFQAAGTVERKWNPRLLHRVLSNPTARSRANWAALVGLLSAWDAHQVPWRDELKKDADLQNRFQQLLEVARPLLLDAAADAGLRREVMELDRFDGERSAVREIALRSGEVQDLRIQAIRFSAGRADREFWNDLFAQFPGESPAVRTAIVNAALAATGSTAGLLDELDAGRIKPQELGRTEVERLQRLTVPELQQRAARILEQLTPADRQQALARYQECLQLEAEPARGRDVFARSCATCHRVGGIGVDVAPDISDSRTKSFEQLLADIVQPNRAIDGNYISYNMQTADGQTHTGIISAETATSITLRQPEDKTITLARSDIEVLQSTGLSLMPEGLEQNLSLQDMADLLSFIKNWRYLDGQIPIEPAR